MSAGGNARTLTKLDAERADLTRELAATRSAVPRATACAEVLEFIRGHDDFWTSDNDDARKNAWTTPTHPVGCACALQ